VPQSPRSFHATSPQARQACSRRTVAQRPNGTRRPIAGFGSSSARGDGTRPCGALLARAVSCVCAAPAQRAAPSLKFLAKLGERREKAQGDEMWLCGEWEKQEVSEKED
jgi:hypothetical protein